MLFIKILKVGIKIVSLRIINFKKYNIMATFERKLDQSIIDGLTKSDLWKNHLKEDCEKQEVFLAIRKNEIGFYHKGGKLFGFDEKSEFKTHIKYAAVIDNTDKDYLTQCELETEKLISDFSGNYKRIKENCSLYSGVEAQGVSEIYHKHSYLSNEDIVVLDIEVSFKAIDENKKQDRIDILLYDTKKRKLKFVEAKHFSNSEIWSKSKPKVIKQIDKYQEQIAKKKPEIIKAYENYITVINKIFDKKLPLPNEVDEEVSLLIFGFDKNQLNGRLNELIRENQEYKGYKVYCIGGIDGVNLDTLWKTNHIKL